MNLLIDDPMDDAALTVLIDAVNGGRSDLPVHVGYGEHVVFAGGPVCAACDEELGKETLA